MNSVKILSDPKKNPMFEKEKEDRSKNIYIYISNLEKIF
jgi:hypothetical protein